MLNQKIVDEIINNALVEDIGYADITSESIIKEDKQTSFKINAREQMIICGLNVAKRVFYLVDSEIQVKLHHNDGDKINEPSTVISGLGNAISIMKAERVALNLLRQMTGVATYASMFVAKTNGTKAKILDTRKTIPNLRILQKYASKIGGAYNHRFGLYDGVMIKDNHIAICGSIKKAVSLAKQNSSLLTKIEVECDNINQVKEAIESGADVILLDNMDIITLTEAVKINNNKIILEASGNVNLKTVENIAKTGVDYISVGAITNNPIAVDIGLDIE